MHLRKIRDQINFYRPVQTWLDQDLTKIAVLHQLALDLCTFQTQTFATIIYQLFLLLTIMTIQSIARVMTLPFSTMKSQRNSISINHQIMASKCTSRKSSSILIKLRRTTLLKTFLTRRSKSQLMQLKLLKQRKKINKRIQK